VSHEQLLRSIGMDHETLLSVPGLERAEVNPSSSVVAEEGFCATLDRSLDILLSEGYRFSGIAYEGSRVYDNGTHYRYMAPNGAISPAYKNPF
jgi:hypothetical protein